MEKQIKDLAKEVEIARNEAEAVNIAILPMEDILKIVSYNRKVNELLNYIGGL